ncbi:MAG: hypothetical protein ABSH12_03040 [Endomicrobiales bacterium]
MKKNEWFLRVKCVGMFIMLFFSVTGPLCALEQVQTQGTLDDVLVKEKDSMGIESEKAPFVIDIDILKEILPIDTTLLERNDELPRISTITIFRPLETQGTVSPWLYSIARNPIVTFRVAGDNTQIDRWELVVVDMQGQPIKHFYGKGPMTAAIEWNGRDDRGSFMRMGEIYSYFVVTVDKTGVKNTSITRPFSIDAAVHKEKKNILISFVLSAVFDKDPQVLTSEEAKRLLTEASDILKSYHHAPFSVKVYDQTAARAQSEAAVVSQFLSDHVMIAPENIPSEGYQSQSNNYHIDLVIKNP